MKRMLVAFLLVAFSPVLALSYSPPSSGWPIDTVTLAPYDFPVMLGDGTDTVEVNSDGSINVTMSGGITVEVSLAAIDDAYVAEGAAATKGVQLLLDNGSVGVFAQGNAGGDLKVTLDSETVSCDGTTLEAIQASLATLDNAISGSEMQVDVVSSANLTIGTFPDNEPFNLAQYGGSTVGASNGIYVAPATSAVFQVGDNSTTLSVDDGASALTVDNGGTFAVQAAQSGTWTVNANGTTIEAAATSLSSIDGKLVAYPSAFGTSYNVTCTVADTEYNQALTNVKRLFFQCRTAAAVRFSDTTGKVAGPVAPYTTLKAGGVYDSGPVSISSMTLYIASSTAGAVVEILVQ